MKKKKKKKILLKKKKKKLGKKKSGKVKTIHFVTSKTLNIAIMFSPILIRINHDNTRAEFCNKQPVQNCTRNITVIISTYDILVYVY